MNNRNSCKLIKVVFVCLVLSSCARSKSNPDFSSEVRNLFFQGNPNDSYESLLKYYRAHPELKEDTSAVWISYPPLSALNEVDEPESHRFNFHKNGTIPSEFESGILTLSSNGYQKTGFDISLHYNSPEQALNGFNQIIGKFNTFTQHIDSTWMWIPNSYAMYADATKEKGISVQCFVLPGINIVSINLLH